MTTGATPFSMVYGAEGQYPKDLFYIRQPGAESLDDGFVDDLVQVFREAHQQARVTLGTNKRRVKDANTNNSMGIPIEKGCECGCSVSTSPSRRSSTFHGRGIISTGTNLRCYVQNSNEPVKVGRWQIVLYNRLKPYAAEAERPRRGVNQSKQTVYEENKDSQAMESEEDTKHETGDPQGTSTGKQTSKEDHNFQSPV